VAPDHGRFLHGNFFTFYEFVVLLTWAHRWRRLWYGPVLGDLFVTTIRISRASLYSAPRTAVDWGRRGLFGLIGAMIALVCAIVLLRDSGWRTCMWALGHLWVDHGLVFMLTATRRHRWRRWSGAFVVGIIICGTRGFSKNDRAQCGRSAAGFAGGSSLALAFLKIVRWIVENN